GSDPGTQQGGDPGEVKLAGYAQAKGFAHHQVSGIAALRRFLGEAIAIGVGECATLAAKLFLALMALVALHAAVHHASDGDVVADAELFDGRSHIDHPTDDFMAWHDGILGAAPVVAGGVEVGVAHAAIKDLHGDVVGSQRPPLEVIRCQRGVRAVGCIADGLHSGAPNVVFIGWQRGPTGPHICLQLHIHLEAYIIAGSKRGQTGANRGCLRFSFANMQDIVMPKKPEKAITVTVRAKSKRKRSTAATGQIPAARVATLKELRKATHHTQDDLAVAMGVGQGTISRIEKRDDMLVSTLQHYVEGVGGTLQILATFPNR